MSDLFGMLAFSAALTFLQPSHKFEHIKLSLTVACYVCLAAECLALNVQDQAQTYLDQPDQQLCMPLAQDEPGHEQVHTYIICHYVSFFQAEGFTTD